MNEHPWLGDVPAFALGALDADERAAFEAHLEGCAQCRAAVREHQRVVDALAGHVPAVAPPTHLKARVLEAAIGERSDVRDRVQTRPPGHPAPSPPPAARPRRSFTWGPWLAAAAAAAFAVWTGLSYQRSEMRADTLAAELANARATIDALEIEGARRDTLLAALTGPAVETVTLASTANEPRVRLFWNRGTDQMIVAAFDLPPAAAGRTYQLWGLAPGADPVSLGTFDTGPAGRVVVLRPLSSETTYAQSAVTEEPAGGSEQPTTTPFLVGRWSSATQ
ncbi:MAG: anti-sigma factor [Longimicrobiales bacterium]